MFTYQTIVTNATETFP